MSITMSVQNGRGGGLWGNIYKGGNFINICALGEYQVTSNILTKFSLYEMRVTSKLLALRLSLS